MDNKQRGIRMKRSAARFKVNDRRIEAQLREQRNLAPPIARFMMLTVGDIIDAIARKLRLFSRANASRLPLIWIDYRDIVQLEGIR